jgi:hypothetical protein
MTKDDAFRKVVQEMGTLRLGNRLLVDVSHDLLPRAVLRLAAALAAERGPGGRILVLSRPYHVLLQALQARGVDGDAFLFLDAVSDISGRGRETRRNVRFLGTPFDLAAMAAALEQDGRPPFVLVDDVAALLAYHDLDTVETFLGSFLDAVRAEPETFAALAADRKTHPDLYAALVRLVDLEVEADRRLLAAEAGP